MIVLHWDLKNSWRGVGCRLHPCLCLVQHLPLTYTLCLSVLLLAAITQNLLSVPHLELAVPPATLRSRQIFRLVELAQSPSEACWCTHSNSWECCQFTGNSSMIAMSRLDHVWKVLLKNKFSLFAVISGLCKAVEAYLQVLNSFILLLETW